MEQLDPEKYISSSEQSGSEDEMVFLSISSSNKGLDEDENKRNGYFLMQKIKLLDNQWVTKNAMEMWYT